MNKLQQKLLEEIKNGELDMKPKWHFILKTILFISGSVLSALMVIYLLSLVVFSLKQTGVWFTLGFGFRGISLFILSSPWILIISAFIFLLVLYLLVKQYSFSYKHPLLYSMLAILLLTLFASFAISQTNMHERMQNFSEERRVLGLRPLYQNVANRSPEKITVGSVREITSDKLVVVTRRGQTLEVQISNDTKLRNPKPILVNDLVVVLGERSDKKIEALEINIIDERQRKHWREFRDQEGQLIKSRPVGSGQNRPVVR